MENHSQLLMIVTILGVAIFFAAAFKRAGVSPLLGYLATGLALGPSGLNWVHDTAGAASLAEYGVIFLLFIIGLELSFEKLMRMRRKVFGFGSAQVGVTGGLIGLGVLACGLSVKEAIIIGGGLALSSTAVVMQLLSEAGERSTQVGRLSLANLILQDLVVIPLLVLAPALAQDGPLMETMGLALLKAGIGMVVIFAVARLAIKPLFRLIATYGHEDLFVGMSLLVVLGLASLTHMAGMSPALGAFMAGLLIAETEFKPQVEADILPFKNIFIGLFFVSVGMSLPLATLLPYLWPIVCITVALMALKMTVLYALCRNFRFSKGVAVHTSLLMAQGGEFAFVLFALSVQQQILPEFTMQLLTASVVLSMALTPLLQRLGIVLERRIDRQDAVRKPLRTTEARDLRDHVIIIGYGRVGQVTARVLEAENIPYLALDMDAGTIASFREKGEPVYFGDASHSVVLKVAGIMRARAVVVAHADMQNAERCLHAIRRLNPTVPVVARARNIEQVFKLEREGANLAIAEVLETSLQVGGAVLREIGLHEQEIGRLIETFRDDDYSLLRRTT